MKKTLAIATQVVLAASLLLLIGCSSGSTTGPSNETVNNKLAGAENNAERISVTGIIASVDYDERTVTLERSSHFIVVDANAKIVGDVGDSRREIRLVDLRAGLLARFDGVVKDKRILVADYVSVNDSFTKSGARTQSN